MSDNQQLPARALFVTNPERLAKQIFQMELSEQEIRALPAQSIYMAILSNGLDSSVDTLLCISDNQLRLVLDFDLWHQDQFLEDNFWNWIELEESSTDPLTVCQKVLRVIDFKLVGFIIAKYIEVVNLEHQSEAPPAHGFYSPDLGFTWIRNNCEDSRKVFLLNRFLALIFETSAEIFYQIISVRNICTGSVLEEEAYQDQRRRLVAEGIPDLELTIELHKPITIDQIKKQIESEEKLYPVIDLDFIPALVATSEQLEPWNSIISQAKDAENLATELTYLINSAMVFYKICPSEIKAVNFLAKQVRGLINLGFEQITTEGLDSHTTLEKLGLKPIYQLGLNSLMSLRQRALSCLQQTKVADLENEKQLLFECLTGRLPTLPIAFDCKNLQWVSFDNKIATDQKAFEEQFEIEAISVYLSRPVS